MILNHFYKGRSPYLATKLNEAKDCQNPVTKLKSKALAHRRFSRYIMQHLSYFLLHSSWHNTFFPELYPYYTFVRTLPLNLHLFFFFPFLYVFFFLFPTKQRLHCLVPEEMENNIFGLLQRQKVKWLFHSWFPEHCDGIQEQK